MPCDFCRSECPAPTEYAVDEADVPVQTTALDGRILRAVLSVPVKRVAKEIGVGDARNFLH